MSSAAFTIPEQIIFFCDTHEEMTSAWDSKTNRLTTVKSALKTFVKRKGNSALQHQFALVTFNSSDNIAVICRFTTSQDMFFEAVDSLHVSPSENVQLDIYHLFSMLSEVQELKLASALDTDELVHRQEYITRVIFIFGRSREVPALPRQITILRNPSVYLDILYLHLKVSQEGVFCQDIYDVLAQMHADCQQNNYIFETHPSTIKLNTYLAALMAHPVQRTDQATFLSKIDVNLRDLE